MLYCTAFCGTNFHCAMVGSILAVLSVVCKKRADVVSDVASVLRCLVLSCVVVCSEVISCIGDILGCGVVEY